MRRIFEAFRLHPDLLKLLKEEANDLGVSRRKMLERSLCLVWHDKLRQRGLDPVAIPDARLSEEDEDPND